MSSQLKTAIVGSACGMWSVMFEWKVMPDGRVLANQVTVSVRHHDPTTGRLTPVKGVQFDGFMIPYDENHFSTGTAMDLWEGIKKYWGERWRRLQ